MENNESLKQELLVLKELLTKYDNAYRKTVLSYREYGIIDANKQVNTYKTKSKELLDQFDQVLSRHLCGAMIPIVFIIRNDALIGTIMLLISQMISVILNKDNFKKIAIIKKYLEENTTSYEEAKQTIKKYDTEIEPQLVKECHPLYDMIIEKVELIKRTSNVFAEFEDITRNQTVIYNTGFQNGRAINGKILDQVFVKCGIEHELEQVFVDCDVEPVQTEASENSKPKVRKLNK